MADVEGRARIEGLAASIHESYMDGHGNKVASRSGQGQAERVLFFKALCVSMW